MSRGWNLRRAGVAAGAGLIAVATVAAAGGRGVTAVVKPVPAVTGHVLLQDRTASTPTSAQCLRAFDIACYSPGQIERHYNLPALYRAGADGRGTTIAIVDSFGSPTIARDLQRFDKAFGLPNASLSIIQPDGAVPPFDPNNSDMVGWAEETTLDVEWSHAIAPGANILLAETPVSETEGVTGFPEIVAAENYVIDHHLGDVISQSFGATEETFPSRQSILSLRSAFFNARRHHVTVLGASGDEGITDLYADEACCYPHPVNSWPSSDPLVTSVGGTEVVPDVHGRPLPLSHDRVWQDYDRDIGGAPTDPYTCCATGGNVSDVFARPAFQDSVAGRVGLSRGTPDISMSASVKGAVLVTSSFQPFGRVWYPIAGTSEASPIFSGIVAIADQLAGHDLGFINPRLYAMAQTAGSGIVDVTRGTNTMIFPDAHNHNALTKVVGNQAGPGYDMSTGLGTADAAVFVPALAGTSG